jgi:hypothetical protein
VLCCVVLYCVVLYCIVLYCPVCVCVATFFAERDGLFVEQVGGLRGEGRVEGDEVAPARHEDE